MSNAEQCPHHGAHNPRLRSDLPPLTDRLQKLPLDARGYPVPRFVQWFEIFEGNPRPSKHGIGYPEFRIADTEHLKDCLRFNKCWVCGETLGLPRAFVVGPMCAINLTSAEPPSHMACAEWSVKGCPFLVNPNMKRREDALTRAHDANTPGIMIKRNPEVILIWHVRATHRVFDDGQGGVLIRLPDPPQSLRYFKAGRKATYAEIKEAYESGLPLLQREAHTVEAQAYILARYQRLLAALPLTAQREA